jgi:hypothetical protein
MGFRSPHEIGETLNPNQLVTLVAMLFSVLLIALTLVGSQMAIQRAFLLAIMVASIYGAAIVAAVLLKGRWPRTAEQRPVIGYVAAGTAAVASAAVLSVAFKSLLYMSFYASLLDLRYTYPYFGAGVHGRGGDVVPLRRLRHRTRGRTPVHALVRGACHRCRAGRNRVFRLAGAAAYCHSA